MLSTMEKQLNESQRDALVVAYMNFVGPTLNGVGGTQLTTEDLYEYLLLDPEIGDEVKTSRVASAIGSVQTYITRIVNGSEPGFQPMVPSTIAEWRENDDQYAIWAAGAAVQNYAENYISPTTRLVKSHYFQDLETALNQNRLDPDRVQDAALQYLNEFEAVSNLHVLSGFIDQDKFARAGYYFIGRTNTEPYQYYWRKMDLSKNRDDYPGTAVTPNCWSDWAPITLPLADKTVLQHTVRAVFYNQRLFVAWVDRNPIPALDENGDETTQHAYKVNFGYKRFDDTWTTPNSPALMTHQAGDADESEFQRDALLIDESASGFDVTDVNLLATADFSWDADSQEQDANPYGRLMLGVFVRNFIQQDGIEKNVPAIYGYEYCDSTFNGRALGPLIREELFDLYKDRDNTTNTLQFALYAQAYMIDRVEPYTDAEVNEIPGGDGNLHGSDTNDESYKKQWWLRINDLKATDTGGSSRIYLDGDFEVRVDLTLNTDFTNDYDFSGDEITHGGTVGYGFGPMGGGGGSGATIRYTSDATYTFQDTALVYDPQTYGQPLFDIPDGQWPLYLPVVSNGSFDPWIQLQIKNHLMAWPGQNNYTDHLDLTGVGLGSATDLKSAITQNEFLTFFLVNNAQGPVAPLQNLNKILTTRKFYCEIRLVSAGHDENQTGASTFELATDSALANISLTHRLSQFDFSNKDTVQDYISFGLIVGDQQYSNGNPTSKQQVWNWYKVYFKEVDRNVSGNLPRLKSNYDPELGVAEYLDFGDSSMPLPTRLNTTFVRKLIDKASLGLDSLLDYHLQTEKLEAPLQANGAAQAMDFYGANGLYFWEVFFHLPFLAAWRYANEQQFQDAQQWLHYIFDPAMVNKTNQAPDYWNVKALTENDEAPTSSLMLEAPLDPDTHGYAHPVVYKKAVFIAYVSNLVAQGDQWYRQMTRDGLIQARVFYNLAANLLGPRPDVTLSSAWTPKQLDKLIGPISQNSALRAFEQALNVSTDGPEPVLVALPGLRTGYLQLADNGNFIPPLNTLLLSHWDTLDARLYNLRHSLTVDGKPMSPPLYAPPADPVALLMQRAQSGALVNGISGAQLTIPPYRFNAILPRAYNAVAALSRFGDTLLSQIERGDNAHRDELQQQQLLEMSDYAMTLQLQEIEALEADASALQTSMLVAQNRHDSYYAFYQENISDSEQQSMDMRSVSQGAFSLGDIALAAAGVAKMIPHVVGLAAGMRWEGALEAVAHGGIVAGTGTGIAADRVSTSEGYRRRRDEWQVQYQQAQDEVDTINAQLDAVLVRKQAAQLEYERLGVQQKQNKVMLDFLQQTRFTNRALYQWLSGQMSSLYYQIYDIVVSQCLAAQACWQYELGNYSTTYMQTASWDDHYRGLQVGETLQLNLQQMEAAYLMNNQRRLEIIRTVSLADLLGDQFAVQKANGKFSFDLKESLFDQDYPGHYQRRIASIWISLPTLLGPYQDVKAVLTQTRSYILLNASIAGVKYLNNPSNDKGDARIVTNLRASQQIALSSGLNDAGLFELNFGDDRYLPFEGTGAVSSWALIFPRADKSLTQQAVLEALADVIVHVRYTALDGGASFAQAVEGTLDS